MRGDDVGERALCGDDGRRAPVIPAPEPESSKGESLHGDDRRRAPVIPAPEPESSNEDPLRGSVNSGKKRVMLGFTLLEVMIALLVITLGIGAVINTT
ncbi:MAG: prepilin-type N-terminal cleavage/methylation domain-containing protein, partial [Gammaproteobacteria bacterium]|nr:prepilin-type N-terminal cleavage/methylation domain-containing protein [Gammaproteobacteria bacterium]